MSVRAIGPISGTTSVSGTYTELQKVQQRRTAELAARADAAKALTADNAADNRAADNRAADGRAAVGRSREAAQQAEAVRAAQRAAEQQVLPTAPTPQQQSRPITASASALGGSFDVTV